MMVTALLAAVVPAVGGLEPGGCVGCARAAVAKLRSEASSATRAIGAIEVFMAVVDLGVGVTAGGAGERTEELHSICGPGGKPLGADVAPAGANVGCRVAWVRDATKKKPRAGGARG